VGGSDLSPGEGRRFCNEIQVRAKVTTMGDDFLVDLEVESEGEFVCDRCGEEFQKGIVGKIQTFFTFDAEKIQEEEGEVHLLSPVIQEIDISQDVRDALFLAIPAKCLCRDRCLGLCPRCGTNLNEKRCTCSRSEEDPRWKALKGLKFED